MGMARDNEGEMMARLDKALNLLALIAARGMPQRDQIGLLDKAGLEPREIAEVLGTTSNTVRVALVGIRRAASQGRRGRPVQEERSNE
jgi:DNA-directed RNA polymerase specialized sigma24 family protein